MADVSVRPARAERCGRDGAGPGRDLAGRLRVDPAGGRPGRLCRSRPRPRPGARPPRVHRRPAITCSSRSSRTGSSGSPSACPAEDFEPGDPEPDSTVAVGPLLVEPRWGRRGHGSRLLAAAIDLARADGMTRAIAWLPEADSTSRGFFASAGWAADGYARVLDTGAGELREVRIHTSLTD